MTGTTQQRDDLAAALDGFWLTIAGEGRRVHGQIADPDEVADVLHATLSRIAAERSPDMPAEAAPAARVFTWDYDEQPPLGEILAKVREMPAPWFWFCPETGTQEYALILSDHELKADEAERILWESAEG